MAMDSSRRDFLNQVLGLFPDWLGWLVFPLTFGYFLWRLWLKQEWALLGNPGNPAFPDRIQRLREKTIAESYRARLNRLLIFVSRLFGPEGVARAGSLGDKLFGCQPWTPLAFERLLLLAIAYPVVFLFIGWLFGEKARLGELVILKPSEFAPKALILTFVGLAFYSGWRIFSTLGWKRVTWFMVNGVTCFAIIGCGCGLDAIVLPMAIALAIIFIAPFEIESFEYGVFFIIAFIVGFSVSMAYVSYFVSPSNVGGVFVSIIVIMPLVLVFTAAIGHRLGQARNRAADRDQLAFFWKSGWFVMILSVLFSLFWIFHLDLERFKIENKLTHLFLLGILPLFNVPLDWLSFGVTRGLLRAIASGDHGWAASLLLVVIDLLLALIFLLAVAGSTLAGIWAVNLIAETADSGLVVGLLSLVEQLNYGGWRENLWIWLMLGSTLIPTAVHFLVALYALALAFPAKKARWAALHMEKARNDWLRRDGEAETPGNAGDVQVHEDARRYAFLHLLLGQTLVTGFWLVSVGGLSYLLFAHSPGWVQAGLDLLGPIITGQYGTDHVF